MMRFARHSLVSVAAALALLTACGSGSSASSSGGTTVDIVAANIAFTPTEVNVAAGDVTFVVKNDDKVEHNLTIDTTGVNKDVEGGATARTKVTLKPGKYAFHCEYHPSAMKGTITVT